MSPDEKYELESDELKLLRNKGFEFTVRYKVNGKQTRKKFTATNPTLAVLDEMSAEWLEFDDYEKRLADGEDSIKVAQRSLVETKRAAKIVALAVIGEDLFSERRILFIRWTHRNRRRLNRLSGFFYRHIKSSTLYALSNAVLITSDLGNFLNSSRLMQVETTTTPTASLIE